MNHAAPIRSRAIEEGKAEIPLWGVPVVLSVLYICLFSGLGAFGLVGPDEPRYAAVARAMAETHDWITPRLWGTPWFEKPVLYYWTAGIAMRIFGVSEFAARLPSALAALLGILAVAWTALRSYGTTAAWYALLILPTSIAVIGFSRAASPDMLFAGLLAAAMAVAIEILRTPRPGPISRIAFGFFLGAAVLAKGPAGVVLAGGATLLWALLTRQWRASFRFLHPLIIVIFCATALPWYILCALRNPDFLRVFIWQHNFERYLTPIFQHPQPFWFFGPIFLLGLLPWLPLFAFLLRDTTHYGHSMAWKDSPTFFIACWTLFPLAFFTLSRSKLPGYALPAIPPMFLLLAAGAARHFEQKTKIGRVVVATVGALIPLLIGIARVNFKLHLEPGVGFEVDPNQGMQIALGIAIAGGALIIVLAIRHRLLVAVSLCTCTIAILLLVVNCRIMPIADGFVSAKQAGTFILLRFAPKPGEVAVFRLPRAYEYGLDYYFEGVLPEWSPENTKALYVFYDVRAEAQMGQRIRNLPAGVFTQATLDGKIYLVFLRHPLNPQQ